MGLEVGGRLDHVRRADHPADPPSGHRVGLGHPVENHTLVREPRRGHGYGGEPRVAVDQVLVDLIGDHPQPGLRRPPADAGHLIGRVHRARRVGRRHEHEHLGARGAGGLQVRHRSQVAGPFVGHDRHRHAAGQGDRLGVGGPVGGGQQDLVAGIEQRGERLEDGLLAAVGDQHLARADLVAGVAGCLDGDRLPQFRQPRRGGVVVEPGLGAGAPGRCHDVVRRGEVRFPGAEADHRPARRPECFRFRVHGQRCRLGNRADTLGDATMGHCHALILSLRRHSCGHR